MPQQPSKSHDFALGNMTKKKCKIWEHVPNCLTPPPLTPLWEHKNLGTFYFSKTPTPPHEFGNIDFGITRCFDSQAPKLGG